MKHIAITAALASVVYAGCWGTVDVAKTIDMDHTITLDLDSDCTGDNSSVEVVGGVDYCVVRIDWTGPMLDFASIKPDVLEKTDAHGIDIEDVSIAAMSMQTLSAYITANGQQLSFANLSAESSISASLAFAPAAPFFSYADSGSGPSFVVDDITYDAPQYAAIDSSVMDNLSTAFRRDRSVEGTVRFELRLPLADLRSALTANPGPYVLNVSARFGLVAQAPIPFIPW